MPYAHLMIPYFVYDLFALCESFSLRSMPREATFLQKWKTFVLKKGSGIVIHHLALLGLGIPLAVVSVVLLLSYT